MTPSRTVVVFSPEALRPYGHCHDYVRGLGGELAARGWGVTVVAWAGPLRLPEPLNVAAVERPAHWAAARSQFRRRWSPLLGDVVWGILRVRSERRLVGALERCLHAEPGAAVLYESFEYVGLSRHLRRDRSARARVTIIHDAGFDTRHASPIAAAYKRLVRRHVRAIVARSTAVLVHGSGMKQALEKNLGLKGTLAAKVRPIPYGAPGPGDVATPDSDTARRSLRLAPVQHVALAFGTLRRDKRFDYVLDGLARAPAWTLLVAGPEGDLSYDEFLAMVRSAGVADRVVLHRGFVEPDRHAMYFGAADLILAIYDPRIRHESGTAQLARSFQRPIVASGGPDLARYVEDTGCGWTADARDASSLATILHRFAAMDAAARDKLRLAVERVAEERSWRAVAATVEGLFAEPGRPAAS